MKIFNKLINNDLLKAAAIGKSNINEQITWLWLILKALKMFWMTKNDFFECFVSFYLNFELISFYTRTHFQFWSTLTRKKIKLENVNIWHRFSAAIRQLSHLPPKVDGSFWFFCLLCRRPLSCPICYRRVTKWTPLSNIFYKKKIFFFSDIIK